MGQGWAVQNKYARIEIEKKEHQKALDERDKEDRPEFIEFYKYENRKFKIIKEDGIYQAISYQMVIGDEDLEVLKDKKIPEYVENEIKNKRGID